MKKKVKVKKKDKVKSVINKIFTGSQNEFY